MNNYILYIYKGGEWMTVDLGNNKPAMNYQTNDIADLKSRQYDYSQALKIPMTKRNCLLFGGVDNIDVSTSFPYIKHECRLFSNGFVIAGVGSYLILDKVTDSFECQIVSSASTLYNALNAPMSDLDLGSIIRNNAACNPVNFTPEYKFAAATFIKGGAPIFQSGLADIFPFIHLRTAIENMLSAHGYTLQTNIADADLEKKYISLASITSDFPFYKANASFEGIAAGWYFPYNITINPSGKLNDFSNQLNYTAAFYCSVRIKVVIESTEIAECYIASIIGGVSTRLYYKSSLNHNIDISIGLGLNDYVNFYALAPSGSVVSSTVQFSIVPANVPYGEILPFANNLGFEKQIDFFKAFLQLFGLSAVVDSENNIVEAYNMKLLYENKIIAKDWSKKLHIKQTEDYFSIGSYAKKNYIKFLDNTDDNVTDKAFFEIQNDLLSEEKEVISFPFQAGMDDYVSGNLVANIPLEEITDTDINFKGCPPHLVELSDDTISFLVDGTFFDYQRAVHVKSQELLDNYYSELKTMLSSARVKEAYFNLSDSDIEKFEPNIPIYINAYGHYFYVNKIINYVSGQLTKCQIIKL